MVKWKADATDARFAWENAAFTYLPRLDLGVLGKLTREHIHRNMKRYFGKFPRVFFCLFFPFVFLDVMIVSIASPLSLVHPTQSLVLPPAPTNLRILNRYVIRLFLHIPKNS